jgi:predicted ATPase
MIQTRMAELTPMAREIVQASAVLGYPVSAQRLRQVAGLEVQPAIHALDEAIASGLLREETDDEEVPTGSYRCAYSIIREVIYTGLSEARPRLLQQRALAQRTERVPISKQA